MKVLSLHRSPCSAAFLHGLLSIRFANVLIHFKSDRGETIDCTYFLLFPSFENSLPLRNSTEAYAKKRPVDTNNGNTFRLKQDKDSREAPLETVAEKTSC